MVFFIGGVYLFYISSIACAKKWLCNVKNQRKQRNMPNSWHSNRDPLSRCPCTAALGDTWQGIRLPHRSLRYLYLLACICTCTFLCTQFCSCQGAATHAIIHREYREPNGRHRPDRVTRQPAEATQIQGSKHTTIATLMHLCFIQTCAYRYICIFM